MIPNVKHQLKLHHFICAPTPHSPFRLLMCLHPPQLRTALEGAKRTTTCTKEGRWGYRPSRQMYWEMYWH